MNILMAVLCLCTVQGVLFAQEDTALKNDNNRHVIAVGASIAMQGSADRLASSANYTGSGVPLRLGYEYQGEKTLHKFAVKLNLSALQSTNFDAEVASTTGALDYLFARKVGGGPECGLSSFVGGEFEARYTVRDYDYGGSLWEGHMSLGPYAQLQGSIENSGVAGISATLPLVGLVTRMPYSVENDVVYRATYQPANYITDLSEVDFIGSFLNVQFSLFYEHNFAPSVAGRVEFAFDWLRYSKPEASVTTTGEAGLSLLWKL